MAPALLVGALAAMLWFLRGDRAEYRSFKRLNDTRDRQRRYRAWIGKAWAAFGLATLLALALLGRTEAVSTVPAEFDALRALLPALGGTPPAFLGGALSGVAIGAVVVGIAQAFRRRRGGGEPRAIGDVAAMLPRNRGEIGHAAALSITAGIVEELFFRLLLPLLVAMVSGDALLGFVVATALFGTMHLYQGWIGVAATALVGALLSAVYLGSGMLWLAMLLHAAIDLGALVLRPLLAGAWRQ